MRSGQLCEVRIACIARKRVPPRTPRARALGMGMGAHARGTVGIKWWAGSSSWAHPVVLVIALDPVAHAICRRPAECKGGVQGEPMHVSVGMGTHGHHLMAAAGASAAWAGLGGCAAAAAAGAASPFSLLRLAWSQFLHSCPLQRRPPLEASRLPQTCPWHLMLAKHAGVRSREPAHDQSVHESSWQPARPHRGMNGSGELT